MRLRFSPSSASQHRKHRSYGGLWFRCRKGSASSVFDCTAPPWAKLEVLAHHRRYWKHYSKCVLKYIKVELTIGDKLGPHGFLSITLACSYRCVGRSSSQTSIFLPSTLRVRCVRPVENCRFCRLSVEIVNHFLAGGKPNVVGAHGLIRSRVFSFKRGKKHLYKSIYRYAAAMRFH